MQRIQIFCQNYGLLETSDDQLEQSFINVILALFTSNGGKNLFKEYMKRSILEKIELELSINTSEGKLVDSEFFIQNLVDSKAAMDELVTRVEEAETNLKGSEEHNRFLAETLSEKPSHMLSKDASAAAYPERNVVYEKTAN